MCFNLGCSLSFYWRANPMLTGDRLLAINYLCLVLFSIFACLVWKNSIILVLIRAVEGMTLPGPFFNSLLASLMET